EAGITAGSNATGNVLTNDTDVDHTNAQLSVNEVAGLARNVGNSVAGLHGAVTINATGSYTYVINNADPAVDQLNSGGTLTDSFTYKVSDGAGGFDTTTLTVTIHGTDDAPASPARRSTDTEAGITAGSNATGNVLTND